MNYEDPRVEKLQIGSYYIVNALPKNYVMYHLEGSMLSEIVDRRYSDFWTLREKLLQNWPCIYVPGLPPKKMIGNLEEDFIHLRTKQLNHFLKEMNVFDEFDNCKEIIAFAGSDVKNKNAMHTLVVEDYPTILKKYRRVFPDYNSNDYDLEAGKKFIEYFRNTLIMAKKTMEVNYFILFIFLGFN